MAIHNSILDTVGKTPLVRLNSISKDVEGEIFIKLEYLSPGFSKKDRAALATINAAEAAGTLSKGQTVIELTSGNMGTGLAIVCSQKGYPFVAVMSAGNSPERADMMRALGAEVILVPQAEGSQPGNVSGHDLALVEETTQELTEKLGAFRADQFNNEACWQAHYHNTMLEILADTDNKVDAVCDFIGSGSSLGGMSRCIHDQGLDIRCYGVEPEGAEVFGRTKSDAEAHPIQGGGYFMHDLPLLDVSLITSFLSVSGLEAKLAAQRLAKEEGIFGGYSTGANLAAAIKLLQSRERGNRVVILACDSGLKYLSTDLWK